MSNQKELSIIGSLLLVGNIFSISLLNYISFFYIAFLIMKKDLGLSMAYILFLIPNLGIVFIQPIPSPFINFLIVICVFKMIFLNNELYLNKGFFFLGFILILFEALHAFSYSIFNILTLISWIFTIVYITVYLSNYDMQKYKEINIKSFLLGIIVSSIYGLLNELINYGKIIFFRASVIDRFSGAAGDPNYLSLYALIALFSTLQLVKNNKMSSRLIVILFVLLPFIASMSLSRMFIVIYLLVAILFFLNGIFYKKYRGIVLTTIVIYSSLLIKFRSVFKNIFIIVSRFTLYKNNLVNLTSNRNIIAIKILNSLNSNFTTLLFGVGLQDYGSRIINSGYAHNVLLELLAAWGLVGSFIFLIYVLYMYKIIKSNKRWGNVIEFLPLISMVISFMVLNIIEVESFYILVPYVFSLTVSNIKKGRELK